LRGRMRKVYEKAIHACVGIIFLPLYLFFFYVPHLSIFNDIIPAKKIGLELGICLVKNEGKLLDVEDRKVPATCRGGEPQLFRPLTADVRNPC